MNKRAFTLMEMVVTMVIMSILTFGIAYIFMEGFRTYVVNRNLIDLRSEARTGLKRMVSEIREAQGGSFASSTDFSINVDVDNDGIVKVVRYYLDGTNLRRQVDGAPSPGNIIMGDIGNIAFTPSGVNTVIIDLTLANGGDSVALSTRARGRCI